MRTHRNTAGGVLAALGVAGALAVPATASAATVVNGGFETGDLSGWTVAEAGSGQWSAYTGAVSRNGQPIGAAPEGRYGATTDQSGPGSHVLMQDVALEAGSTHVLKLFVYGVNRAPFLTPSPATLAFSPQPNQQYRVDVMKPTAAATSVDPADVLATVHQSQTGDPLVKAPTELTADLSAFAGETVKLRLAETDNRGNFSAAVDDVRIASTPIPVAAPAAPLIKPEPEPEPEVAPEPASSPAPAAQPAAIYVARVCTSRRNFLIRLRPGRAKLASAVVRVDGRKVKLSRSRGRLTAFVDLRGRPKGIYAVSINARDAKGRHYRETRSYKTCAPSGRRAA